MARREAGSGTVYQRKDGTWVGRAQVGYTDNGTPRRIAVSAKTEGTCARLLRERIAEVKGGAPSGDMARMTVKAWAADWLAIKKRTLRPNGYSGARTAAAWIVREAGHRRLKDLTRADVRKIEDAQRAAGNRGSSARTTHNWLLSMLSDAVDEGYTVPETVLNAPRPSASASDRTRVPDSHLEAILTEAFHRGDGIGLRWLVALLYGWRQNEVLGLTVDALDFTSNLAWMQWQLQALPYNAPRDRKSGFRVPADFECRQLVDAWHLVRPKSAAGQRWAPIPEVLVAPLRAQARVASQIPNGLGLLFCHPDGRPINGKQDREQWHDLQATVGVSHPSGRPWTVHECRNTAASRMRNAGADEMAQLQLMGHADIKTTQGYQTVSDVGQAVVVGEMVKGLHVPGIAAKPGRRASAKTTLRLAARVHGHPSVS